jgi:hypothetical protein
MKTEKFDYLLVAGPTKDTLDPECAYRHKEDAIEAAKSLQAKKIKAAKCIEVVYMPEDDDNTNEVVWSNCKEKS